MINLHFYFSFYYLICVCVSSAYLALGKFQDAINTLEEAVKLDPHNENSRNLLKTAQDKAGVSSSSSSSGPGGSGWGGMNIDSLSSL
jgi:tetratricopeptide (TPR) repeat protein